MIELDLVGWVALSLRATLFLSVACVVAKMASRASADIRHLVVALGLAGIPVILLFGHWMPRLALEPVAASIERSLGRAGPVLLGPWRAPTPEPTEISGAGTTGTTAAAPSTSRRGAFEVFFFFYVCGVSVLAWRLAAGCHRLGSLRRTSRPIKDESVLSLLGELEHQLGLRFPVRVISTGESAIPSTWGVFRPVILLPETFHSWPRRCQRHVLAHELAHLRRRDPVWGFVTEVAVAVSWWNPLVWWAARRVAEESELACDERVVGLAGAPATPADYAQDLLFVAAQCRQAPASPALAAFRVSGLRGRIEALLARRGVPRHPQRTSTLIGISSLATVLAVTIAGADLRARDSGVEPRSVVGELSIESIEPQQMRWSDGREAVAFFAEGGLALERLWADEPFLTGPGLFFLVHERPDGNLGQFVAFIDPQGQLRQVAEPVAVDTASPDWVRALLATAATGWRSHPDTPLGRLDRLTEIAGLPDLDLTGSQILGLPGRSVDPSSGFVQAGWERGPDRYGAVARLVPGRWHFDRRPLHLAAEEWVVLFRWQRQQARLSVFEGRPDSSGQARWVLRQNGARSDLDDETRQELEEILAAATPFFV